MNNNESSLTAPADRDRENKWRPQMGQESLTNTEAQHAMNELNETSFTDKFPRVDRTYADPPLTLQNIGLISFVPASGAKPNENGVFGFAKLRGNFQTEMEASQRAEFIVRNVDSYHKIFHTYVGRPFPITCTSDYSKETDEIDIRKEMANTISKDIRKKKQEEQNTVKDMQEREKALIEESKREDVDPYEHYITQRVKKAQLSWTYLEHIKKLEEVKKAIAKAHNEIITLEKESPEFKESYYQKYLDARKDAGIKDNKDTKNSFLRFMVEDAELPGLDLIPNEFFDLSELE